MSQYGKNKSDVFSCCNDSHINVRILKRTLLLTIKLCSFRAEQLSDLLSFPAKEMLHCHTGAFLTPVFPKEYFAETVCPHSGPTLVFHAPTRAHCSMKQFADKKKRTNVLPSPRFGNHFGALPFLLLLILQIVLNVDSYLFRIHILTDVPHISTKF